MGRLEGLSRNGYMCAFTAIMAIAVFGTPALGQAVGGSCAELGALKNSGKDVSGALARCIAESTDSLQLEPGIYTIAKEVVVNKEIAISTSGIARDAGPCGSGGRTCAAFFRSPEFVGSNPLPAKKATAGSSGAALLRLTGANASLHHLEIDGIKNLLAPPPSINNESLIAINDCRGCRVESLVLKGGVGASALLIERSANVSVKDSIFKDNGSASVLTSGVEARSSSDVEIVGNFFKNSSKYDVNVMSCTECEVARNVMWHTKSSHIAAIAALRVVGTAVSVHDNVADCDTFGCNSGFVFGGAANKGKEGAIGSSITAFNNVASHALNGFQFGLRSKIELVDNYTLGNTGALRCSGAESFRFAKLPGASIAQSGSSPKLSEIVEAKFATKALSQRERESCRTALNTDIKSGASALSGREAFLSNAVILAFRNVLGRAPSVDEQSVASLQLSQGTPLSDIITGIGAGSDNEKKRGVAQGARPNSGGSASGSQHIDPAVASTEVNAVKIAASAQPGVSAPLAPPAAVSLALGSSYGTFSLRVAPLPVANTLIQYNVIYRSSYPAGCTNFGCEASALSALFPNPAAAKLWLAFGTAPSPKALTSNPPELCAYVRARYVRGTTYSAPVYRSICSLVPILPSQPKLSEQSSNGLFTLSLSQASPKEASREYDMLYLAALPTGCTSQSCPSAVIARLFSDRLSWSRYYDNTESVVMMLLPADQQRCAVVRTRSRFKDSLSSTAYAAYCHAGPSLSTRNESPRFQLDFPMWGSSIQWQYNVVFKSILTPAPAKLESFFSSSLQWQNLGGASQLRLNSKELCAIARVRAVSLAKTAPSPVQYLSTCLSVDASVELFSKGDAALDPESRFIDGAQLVFVLDPAILSSIASYRIMYNIEPVDRFLTNDEMRSRKWGPTQELVTSVEGAHTYLPLNFSDFGGRNSGCAAIRYKRSDGPDWSYLSQCLACEPPEISEPGSDRFVLNTASSTDSPDVQFFQAPLPSQRPPFAPQRGGWRTVTTWTTLSALPGSESRQFEIRLDNDAGFDRSKSTLVRYRHKQSGCGQSPYEYRFLPRSLLEE